MIWQSSRTQDNAWKHKVDQPIVFLVFTPRTCAAHQRLILNSEAVTHSLRLENSRPWAGSCKGLPRPDGGDTISSNLNVFPAEGRGVSWLVRMRKQARRVVVRCRPSR